MKIEDRRAEQINPINPKDYHYDGKEIVDRAMENLKGHKPYQKLKDELKRIKDINPRALERVYDTVLGGVSKGDALFALRLVLK